MSTNPVVLNPVTMNADLTKAIQDALDPADIRAAILSEAAKQTNATTDAAIEKAATDKLAADKVAADAAAAANAGFSRTENIGGKEFTFEAASELELERIVNNAYKVAYALQPAETHAAEFVDPAIATAAAQKAAEDEAIAKADLELKFKRGEITAADYIEQSGAMKDYLAKQGVPLEALRDAVTHNQDAAESQSWADATQVFLNSPAGSDWPGGDKNLALIGDKLAALGLVDAKDKVAALAQAFASMKSTGTIFPYEDPATAGISVAAVPAAAAVVPVAVVPAATPRAASTSSSLFGASSGVSGSTGVPSAAAGTIEIPKDASPAEIIDAWKKGQVAAGKDPNAAFTETFSARRV